MQLKVGLSGTTAAPASLPTRPRAPRFRPQRAVERVDTELGKTREEIDGGECSSETRALLGSFVERASSFLEHARPQMESVLRANELTQEACRRTAEVRAAGTDRRGKPAQGSHALPYRGSTLEKARTPRTPTVYSIHCTSSRRRTSPHGTRK